MKDIANLNDEELYNLIDNKTYNGLSNEDIQCLLNIIRKTIKDIDEGKYS